jgi:hypothetical protein
LRLRQNQAALRRLFVDGDNQNGAFSGRNQVRQNSRRVQEIVRHQIDQRLADLGQALAADCADHDGFEPAMNQPVEGRIIGLLEVALVDHGQNWNLARVESVEKSQLQTAKAFLG